MTPIAITSVEVPTCETKRLRLRAPRWWGFEPCAEIRRLDRFALDIWRHLEPEALQ